MKKLLFILLLMSFIMAGCGTTPRSERKRAELDAEVNEAIAVFKARTPGIEMYFDDSIGYAVLPRITKGAFWVGGAWGRGQVFREGTMIGYTSMTQGTLGFSFGGQFFREIIFFQNDDALNRFKEDFVFTAEASAVAARAGAITKTDYRAGMAAFIITDGGLMIDASLGGQKFNFSPVDAW